MTEPTRKKALIALLERGRQEEQRVWEQASQSAKEASGLLGAWELKDTVAHVAEWKDRDASRLDSVRAGLTPERAENFDAANAVTFESHRDKTWNEVMEFETRAFEHLVASVDAFTEDDLFGEAAFEWTSARSLAWFAAFSGYHHPQSHLSELLLKDGDLPGAEEVQLRIVEAMDAVDDSPRARGANLYNLACFYALHDMPDKAMDCLSRSFALRPDLMDWSKQDSDLDPLREIPRFRELTRP